MDEQINQAPLQPAAQPPVPQQDKPSLTLALWIRALTFLFLISALSGMYIIFSGGANPKPKEEVSDTKGIDLGALTKKTADGPGVAIVKIRGMITETTGGGWSARSASALAKKIKTLSEKENVKAIVLDIDSPGGTIAATQEIYYEILRARKEKGTKFVSMIRDVGASGAYYISVACDKVMAQPGSTVGSIGVIAQLPNVEGLAEKIGFKMTTIKSGANKDMGSPFSPLTAEQRTLMQHMTDDFYAQFFDAVKENRPNMNPTELKVYADGRVFSGRQAFSIGLVDALGGEVEAVKLAGDLAGIKDAKVISVKAESFRDFFLSLDSNFEGRFLGKALQEISTPKAQYLWAY